MLMPQERARRLFFPQAYADGEWAQWSRLPYWWQDVELSGCGLCSATVCIDLLTNRDLTPRDVLARYREDGMDGAGASKVGGRNMSVLLNEYNARAFGIRSFPIERSVGAFRQALGQGDVIWASSSDR